MPETADKPTVVQINHVLQGSLGQDGLAPPAGATVQEPPLPRHAHDIEDCALKFIVAEPVDGVNFSVIRLHAENMTKQ